VESEGWQMNKVVLKNPKIPLFIAEKSFFYQKLQYIYKEASVKASEHQATGEAFSPQKRIFSTPKHYISALVYILGVIFVLDSDPV
jgi:hypothetical protein